MIRNFISLNLMILFFVSCGSGSGTTSANDQISNDTSTELNILKVANPNHTAAQGDFVFKIEGKEQQTLYKSSDRGATFSECQTLADDLRITRMQSLFITPMGNLIWAHAASDPTIENYENRRILINIFRSIDQGESFEQTSLIVPHCDGEPINSSIQANSIKSSLDDLGGSACGLFGITWTSGGEGYPLYLILGFQNGESLDFYRSDDDGRTFSEIQEVDGVEWGDLDPSRPSINFATSEENLFFSVSNKVELLKSSNTGIDFEELDIPGITESSQNEQVRMAIEGNNLYLVYRITGDRSDHFNAHYYFVKSADGGESFSEPLELAVFGADPLWENEGIEVFEDNVYILWVKERVSDDKRAVYLSHSIDGGETFGEIERISDYTAETPWASSFMDKSGNLFVFWTDTSMSYLRF